jgi:lysyl-tRNA synthetase, class II
MQNQKSRFTEIRDQRLEKLAKLRELGINPFPAQSVKDHPNQHIIDNYSKFEGKELTLTGRLMSWRGHGKLNFADLQDQSGTIQLVCKEGDLTDTSADAQTIGFSDLNLIDIGDFVQVTGKVGKTKSGQLSLMVTSLSLLTKSIRPLPEKREGLKDKEQIFRRRYLDLTMNQESREMFVRKSKFWAANRKFLTDQGFIEVETPVLEHVTGGADAKPFVTHHHALDQDFYLRISQELQLKRLIGGGFEKVFNLGPNFRNEGIDDEHLQEYYQCEWYWAYADYQDNMNMLVEMFRYIAMEVYGRTEFTRGEHTFDLANDWVKIDYVEIIQDKLGIDIFTDSLEKMLSVLKEHKVKLTGEVTKSRVIDNLWKILRRDIAGPAFLINEPKFMSPLAKSKMESPELTERFHIVIAGSELGNGYSELNDPVDQLERFREQQGARDAGDEESQMLDIDYVEMLEYGMPPTSGYAHSERLFWFLENVTAREGTLFPQMKSHISPMTRNIYGIKED